MPFQMLRGKLQVWVPCAWNLFPKEDVRSFESSGQPVVNCRNNLVDMPQVASKTVGKLAGQDSFLRLIRYMYLLQSINKVVIRLNIDDTVQ